MWLLLAGLATGCSGGGSSTPKTITADEQRQMDEAEQKATAEESAQRKNEK